MFGNVRRAPNLAMRVQAPRRGDRRGDPLVVGDVDGEARRLIALAGGLGCRPLKLLGAAGKERDVVSFLQDDPRDLQLIRLERP
jgi:hypothetical protein